MYGKIVERHNHIDMDLSNLLCETELSFDYGQEFLVDRSDEACRCLDMSTSNCIRLLERYRGVLFMYYGEDVRDAGSEFDKVREAFLSIHHAVPEHPRVDIDNTEELKEGFGLLISDMEALIDRLDKLNVYYGSKELIENIMQNIRSKELVN